MDIPKISQWCAEFFIGSVFSIFFLIFEALVSWLAHHAWWLIAVLLQVANALVIVALLVLASYSAWRGLHTPAKRHVVVNVTFIAGMASVVWYIWFMA